MELRQIQYFIQLYQDRNITKASKNLYISQQGLSKSVSRLEEELGFPLFERCPSGVIPTEEASLLFTHFNKIANSYHELLLAVDHIRQNRILTITAFHGFALSCKKDLFSEYKKQYPEARLHYEEKDNTEIPSYLFYQRSDIAFMLAPIPKQLHSLQIVRTEPVHVVVSKKHPLASKTVVHIQDLAEQNFVFLDIMKHFNNTILQKADAEHIPYHIRDTVNMNEFFHILHDSSLIGFSSRLMYQYHNFPEITFIPFCTEESPELLMETHLTSLSDHIQDEEIQHFIDYVTQKSI